MTYLNVESKNITAIIFCNIFQKDTGALINMTTIKPENRNTVPKISSKHILYNL